MSSIACTSSAMLLGPTVDHGCNYLGSQFILGNARYRGEGFAFSSVIFGTAILISIKTISLMSK